MGEVVKFPPARAEDNYVSPYLLRPLRRKEEVEGVRAGDGKADRRAEEKPPLRDRPTGAAE